MIAGWPSPGADVADRVFLPALARFPAELRELMGLLPVVDINGGLLAALRAHSGEKAGRTIAGLFATDPFLDRKEMAGALHGAGFARIANFPTVQLFDAGTAAGLAGVGYDLEAELAILQEFAVAGFETVAYVTTPAAAALALERGFMCLAFHPGLSPVRGERATLARIERLTEEAGAELLRHRIAAWQEC